MGMFRETSISRQIAGGKLLFSGREGPELWGNACFQAVDWAGFLETSVFEQRAACVFGKRRFSGRERPELSVNVGFRGKKGPELSGNADFRE